MRAMSPQAPFLLGLRPFPDALDRNDLAGPGKALPPQPGGVPREVQNIVLKPSPQLLVAGTLLQVAGVGGAYGLEIRRMTQQSSEP